MPLCKFCINSDLYKRDKYNCVLCKTDHKYYYQAEQINNCPDYQPTNRSSYNDDYELTKADKKLGYTGKNYGCFITTTLCYILGFKDNCIILNILRNLRDNFMIGKPEYNDLLIEYYVVGPIISENLLNEKQKISIANNLYHEFILPSCCLIIDKHYEEAINKYCDMVNALKNKYQVPKFNFEYDHSIQLNTKEDFKKIIKQ